MSSPPSVLVLSNSTAICHLERAKADYQTFQAYLRLREKGRLDWAAVFLFYAALHLVDAYVVEAARDAYDVPKGHRDDQRPGRGWYVRNRLPTISHEYHFLHNRSNIARYHPEE